MESTFCISVCKFKHSLTIITRCNPQTDVVQIRLFDKDKLSRDDPMGFAQIGNLNSLYRGVTSDHWLKLQQCKSGEIRIQLTPVDFGLDPMMMQQNMMMMQPNMMMMQQQPNNMMMMQQPNMMMMQQPNMMQQPYNMNQPNMMMQQQPNMMMQQQPNMMMQQNMTQQNVQSSNKSSKKEKKKDNKILKMGERAIDKVSREVERGVVHGIGKTIRKLF